MEDFPHLAEGIREPVPLRLLSAVGAVSQDMGGLRALRETPVITVHICKGLS